MTLFKRGFLLLLMSWLVACGGSVPGTDGTQEMPDYDDNIVRIELATRDMSIPKGTSAQFEVVGFYANGEKHLLTESVEWYSDAESVAAAKVDGDGLVKGLATGSANIFARYQKLVTSHPLLVRDAELRSVEVDSQQLSIPAGVKQNIVVTGIYTDNTKQQLHDVRWFVEDDSVAIVEDKQIMAVNSGMARLVMSSGDGQEFEFDLSVTPAVPVSMQLRTAARSVPQGTYIQIITEVVYSDGRVIHPEEGIEWVFDEAVVSRGPVSAGTIFRAAGQGRTSILAQYAGLEAQLQIDVLEPSIRHLVIESSLAQVAVGRSHQLRAVALLSNDTKVDVTESVRWSSSNNTVLRVSNGAGFSGVLRARKQGYANAVVRLGDMSAEFSIEILEAELDRLDIVSESLSIPLGDSSQFRAEALYSDGSRSDVTQDVIWSVDRQDMARISNSVESSGRLDSLSPGRVKVMAQMESTETVIDVVVSEATLTDLEIFSDTYRLSAGNELALKATGLYSDGSKRDLTHQVSWTSLQPESANFSGLQRNELRAIAPGKINIEVHYSNTRAEIEIEITEATLVDLQLNAPHLRLVNGYQMQISATAIYSDSSKKDVSAQVVWQVSDNRMARINNSQESSGLLRALSPGELLVTGKLAGIEASLGLEIVDAPLVNIVITVDYSEIPAGVKQQITAQAIFGNGDTRDITEQVNWNSSDNQKLVVLKEQGRFVVKGLSVGEASIFARFDSIAGQRRLTITPATVQKVEINPRNLTINAGFDARLKAIALLSDGTSVDVTDQAQWQSTTPHISVISNAGSSSGLAQALSQGDSIISASYSGKSGTTEVTISDAILNEISISPGVFSIANGNSIQLSATGLYSDGSRQDMTNAVVWAVEEADRAHISNEETLSGVLTARNVGDIKISAAYEGKNAYVVAVVSDAVLDSISIDTGESRVPLGTSHSLKATGNYSDGSIRDLTQEVVWESSDRAILDFQSSNSTIRARQIGEAVITAGLHGVSGSFYFTVTPAVLQSMTLSPANVIIANKTGVQLTASGIFSDGNEQDVTSSVVWSSADAGIAVISNADDSRGWVDALAPGVVTLSATHDGVSADVNVTVSDAVLQSIEIRSNVESFARGTQLKIAAIGHFSGDRTQVLTRYVNWGIENGDILTIDQGLTNVGLLSGISAGSTEVTASFNGISASRVFTVVDQPDMPVGLASLAIPNVIINNDVDVSTILLKVRAADPVATVADTTKVNLEIVEGTALLSSTVVTTTNGIAQFGLRSSTKGVVRVKATIEGTTISRHINIYVSDTLAPTLTHAAISNLEIDGDRVKAGSVVGLALANISTRPYYLLQFTVKNRGEVLAESNAAEALNNHLLFAGMVVANRFQLDEDLGDPQFELEYIIQDILSGDFFSYSVKINPTVL